MYPLTAAPSGSQQRSPPGYGSPQCLGQRPNALYCLLHANTSLHRNFHNRCRHRKGPEKKKKKKLITQNRYGAVSPINEASPRIGLVQTKWLLHNKNIKTHIVSRDTKLFKCYIVFQDIDGSIQAPQVTGYSRASTLLPLPFWFMAHLYFVLFTGSPFLISISCLPCSLGV